MKIKVGDLNKGIDYAFFALSFFLHQYILALIFLFLLYALQYFYLHNTL